MSKDEALEFMREVAADEELEEELYAAVGDEAERAAATAAFALQRGRTFTAEELVEVLEEERDDDRELGDDELDSVAGGVGQSGGYAAHTQDFQRVSGLVLDGDQFYLPACFPGWEKVRLVDGSVKTFSELSIGDVLEGGSRVYAIMIFEGRDTPLYDYDGVRVAGEHYVQENGAWVKVEDSERAVLTDCREETLWDLLTSDQKIPVGDSVFWDYEDDICETLGPVSRPAEDHVPQPEAGV